MFDGKSNQFNKNAIKDFGGNLTGNSGGAAFEDARRTPRRVFRRPVGVLHSGCYRVFQATQLSEGGLVFKTELNFKINDQVVTSICLPDGSVVVARGEIIELRDRNKSTENLTGKTGFKECIVKFLPLSLQLRRRIRNYVTAKTQQEAELESDQETNLVGLATKRNAKTGA